MSATLYLKGGAVIPNVMIGTGAIHDAVKDGKQWIQVQWQPSLTPHNPETFTLDVRPDEIAAIQRSGR